MRRKCATAVALREISTATMKRRRTIWIWAFPHVDSFIDRMHSAGERLIFVSLIRVESGLSFRHSFRSERLLAAETQLLGHAGAVGMSVRFHLRGVVGHRDIFLGAGRHVSAAVCLA